MVMVRTPIRDDLDCLDTLISGVMPNRSAPLADWRKRLEDIALRHDSFTQPEQQHLQAIIDRVIELECTAAAPRAIY